MNHYFEKTLKSASTFLSRWNDATAEMWELTSSHKTLTIVIRRNNGEGNLVIACLDPVSINGPVRWARCQLQVTTITPSNDEETYFLVEDQEVGLQVVCGALEVAENVKL